MRTLKVLETEDGPSWLVDFRDIDEQLRYLRTRVDDYRMHPVIRDKAMSIIREAGVEPRDKKGQALALGQWVQDNVYYVHERPERFATPIETLKKGYGDCDDTTVLIAAMLEAVGIPSRLVCMKIDHVFKHIFPAAIMENNFGALLPLDSTMKNFRVVDVKNPIEWAMERGKVVSLKLA